MSDSFSLNGKSVLITGGTGSFGQKFVQRLLATEGPSEIVIYSRDELKQFEMDQGLRESRLRFVLGDVRDEDRLRKAMKGIDVVVHAAALKQVVAAEYNPIECIKTNIMGGENVINSAIACGVDRVIALSTDKAVNPVNLYGATKLCSDKLFVAANHLAGTGDTRFAVVRYGNVIGSRGSVIPFFRAKRAEGRIPVTDTRMTRFWITVDQGVDFVVRSLSRMHGGEVFIRKSPSMRIMDLAKAVAPECEIDIIGIRPGEKLHEIMVPRDEAMNTVEFSDFLVIRPAFDPRPGTSFMQYQGVEGAKTSEDFEYRSDNNTEWLDADGLAAVVAG